MRQGYLIILVCRMVSKRRTILIGVRLGSRVMWAADNIDHTGFLFLPDQSLMHRRLDIYDHENYEQPQLARPQAFAD